ncbi:MAG: SDR family oxidoreductase [Proteiniphilum sp.]|jgi:NAD(P)-dependent dehydrogenase (short-subunit alcohol dehydrogenase family)|nr:SDR family oxidoreductase [Proteiniphilum sp.]NCB25148.1 SDR family oxidoreductase [Bacteroidia bacterium]MDD2936846.1 SDR family oxidoreductase [Proteiniphilum sp.]MDD3076517.1 SDR family oxidoreductase [Proteiniphilum sp.]MDD3779434.1 SDR family oxidoreductase [Proteiniphilum sp.]
MQDEKKIRPAQKQQRPGKEKKMKPVPDTSPVQANQKLKDRIALITGGDSGIGKATALLFAAHGANIAIAYLSETEDARDTRKEIEEMGRQCLLIKGDLSKESNCKKAIEKTIDRFSRLDILINNAALHWEQEKIEDITTEQLERTFYTNFFSYFWVTKYAVPHLKEGSTIVNTASVTAYRGSPKLLDYAASKGAIVAFTRSLAQNLTNRKIRVNAVAPGPIWTPLIASTFDKDKVAKFGSDKPMGRAGQPNEVATCFLFLASDDASYMSGQCLHPNGGEIING